MTFLSCPWPLKSKYTAGIYIQGKRYTVHLVRMLFFFSVEWNINYKAHWRSKTNMIFLTKNKRERTEQKALTTFIFCTTMQWRACNVNNKPTELKAGTWVYLAKSWCIHFKTVPLCFSCFFTVSWLFVCWRTECTENVNHAAERQICHTKECFVRLLPVRCEITRADNDHAPHGHNGKAWQRVTSSYLGISNCQKMKMRACECCGEHRLHWII